MVEVGKWVFLLVREPGTNITDKWRWTVVDVDSDLVNIDYPGTLEMRTIQVHRRDIKVKRGFFQLKNVIEEA